MKKLIVVGGIALVAAMIATTLAGIPGGLLATGIILLLSCMIF